MVLSKDKPQSRPALLRRANLCCSATNDALTHIVLVTAGCYTSAVAGLAAVGMHSGCSDCQQQVKCAPARSSSDNLGHAVLGGLANCWKPAANLQSCQTYHIMVVLSAKFTAPTPSTCGVKTGTYRATWQQVLKRATAVSCSGDIDPRCTLWARHSADNTAVADSYVPDI
jgi:hypothetical protein